MTITVTEEGVLELYPRLSDFQATFLRDMADGFAPVLFLVVPDENKDDAETLASRTRSNKEIEQLVDLGLLENGNVEGQFDIRLNEYREMYNRQVRVFTLTKLGKEMFRRPFGKEDPIN